MRLCGLGRRPAGNLSLTCILANGQRGKELCGRVASPLDLPALPGLRSKLQLNELSSIRSEYTHLQTHD